MDLHPRFYLPWACNGYFTVEPSVGLRQTAWLVDDYENEATAKDNFNHRTIYDIKLDLATNLYRIYAPSVFEGPAWRHALTPRVVYDYIPNQNQDEYPDFDDIDRIDPQNTITYSITNTLTAKYLMPANHNTKKAMAVSPGDLYRYKQFCRIKLEQSYDFNEAREPSGEPFSPISGELELKPSDMISLQADAQWSVYENDFVSDNIALKFANGRKDKLSVEYRHQDEDVDDDENEKTHSLYINGLINIGDRWALFSEYEHSFEDNDDLTVAAGFRYRASCWALECKYSDESGDQKYAFMVTLNGLGDIGTSF